MSIAGLIIVVVGAVTIVKMMIFTIVEPVMTGDVRINLVMIILIPRKKKLRNVVIASGLTNTNVLVTGDRGSG